MKYYWRNILVFFSLLTTIMISQVSEAQNYQITKLKSHPYIHFTDERVQEIKNRMEKDTALRRGWDDIKTKADEAIVRGKGGDMLGLSLAYRMTKDKRYALQAKILLENSLKSKAWDGLDDRTPRWNSALGTAHKSGEAATTFDAIYDILTNQERLSMAQRIVELGIQPSIDDWISADKRLHTLNSMGHNWWSALVFNAGLSSLAVMHEIPQAKQWAAETMEAAEEWFAFNGSLLENKVPNFDPKGGFYESIGYANYGLGEYLLFRLAWTNAIKSFKAPYDNILKGSMHWFMDMSYPRSEQLYSLNFGDGSYLSNGERPVKLMMALGFDEPSYHWYLSQTSKGSFREDLTVQSPFGFIYHPAIDKNISIPLRPLSSIYDTMGWASMRSSWSPDATLLGIKSGYTWNHAHADAGSFMIFHKGKKLLIDGGNVNYGNPAYSDYSVRSDAHNVILFNGMAQEYQDQYHGVKTPGTLSHLLDAGDLKYILADATGPTSHNFLRNFRSVLWIGSVILIIDDVKAYQSGKFEWLLHTGVPAVKKGIDMEVVDGNAGVLVRPLWPETLPNGYPHDFPEKMRLEEHQGIKDHDPTVQIPYYSFIPPDQSKQAKFVTAVFLLEGKNKPLESSGLGRGMVSDREQRSGLPEVERLEGKDMIGVRIKQDGKVTDVYINLVADGRLMHRNSRNIIDGWETDAYLLAFTYPDGKDSKEFDRLFVANGSYVRRSNFQVLSSLSKVYMVAEQKGTDAKVVLQGQPIIKASVKMPTKVLSWRINDKVEKLETNGLGAGIIRITNNLKYNENL